MGFFDGPRPNEVENWVCILERGTEYEVALARNYLANLRIPSNILSKRDSSVNLNIGETSMVYLYVPKEYEKRARRALEKLESDEVDLEKDFPEGDELDEEWNKFEDESPEGDRNEDERSEGKRSEDEEEF